MKQILYYKLIALAAMLLIAPAARSQRYYNEDQRFTIGLHFDPLVGWFGSDNARVNNKGARPGYNLGIDLNRYFGNNYSLSFGLDLIGAGGRLVHADTTVLEFANFTSRVMPGDPVIYRIQYLSFPLGLKLQTNQIGYITYFADLGFDPKIAVGGKIDIKDNNIEGENATSELKIFNLSWHITGGIEYSIGGSSSLVLGLNFENNFFDITKETGIQPEDKITHKMLSVRMGIIF
jgi:hypothetical protein